ncbi:hypothetical protein CP8484711_1638B, partial [Chlamydia psittaci 84-8471/1]
YKKK